MPDLSPDILAAVVQACKTGAAEAADSFRRNLDADVKVSVGEPGTIDTQALPEGFTGPGFVVTLTCGSSAALVVLPEGGGVLPGWYAEPDPTGQSKLATLSQELGMVLLPESHMPDDSKAGAVKIVAGALARGGVVTGAAMVPLSLEGAGKKALAYLIWPASKPAAVLGAGGPAKPAAKPAEPKPAAPKPAAPKLAAPKPVANGASAVAAKPVANGASPAATGHSQPAKAEELPAYTKSLLRIQVPVIVTLAQKRQSLGWIVELGPGSIIQFDKSCEEMLQLDVGGHPIATGEAVKVGDKFGLRITSVVLPDERFNPVKGKK